MAYCKSLVCTLLFLGSSGTLTADIVSVESSHDTIYTPWLTGPLIAPFGAVVPVGHFTIQPYTELDVFTGNYSAHWKRESIPTFYSFSQQVLTLVGLTEWMDFLLVPTLSWKTTEGKSSTRFGDLPLTLDFQLIGIDHYKWFPGLKLQITETFPTGEYQKLNPSKLYTDASGLGSFSTAPALVFYKVYHLHKHHFMSFTASIEYTWYAPVHVQGFNTYGGGPGARGKVYPGNLTTGIVSFEYSLDQNWALALDNIYIHSDKDRFRGNVGHLPGTLPSVFHHPSYEQLSFAPAIEYNFNEHWGIIGGTWFTAAGRNSTVFYSGIITFAATY